MVGSSKLGRSEARSAVAVYGMVGRGKFWRVGLSLGSLWCCRDGHGSVWWGLVRFLIKEFPLVGSGKVLCGKQGRAESWLVVEESGVVPWRRVRIGTGKIR